MTTQASTSTSTSMAREWSAPALVAWQLTRACNLACRHCCTESAPGRALLNELARDQSLAFARDVARAGVPKVMLCGGEPLLVPWFSDVADALGAAGVVVKVETNGHLLDDALCARLATLPTGVSVQISLDGITPRSYGRLRLLGDVDEALRACRAVHRAGLALEVTFAPTRDTIDDAEAVLDHALALGAFRFNTGMLMPVGTARKHWAILEPRRAQYASFFRMLRRRQGGSIELAFRPWSLARELRGLARHTRPPSTMLVLPDGRVKVCAALPHTCADVRRDGIAGAWRRLRDAWTSPLVAASLAGAAQDPASLAQANAWVDLSESACSIAVAGSGAIDHDDDREKEKTCART